MTIKNSTYEAIEEAFGGIVEASEQLGMCYRTLRKVVDGTASQATMDRIRGKGYDPVTFKPL